MLVTGINEAVTGFYSRIGHIMKLPLFNRRNEEPKSKDDNEGSAIVAANGNNIEIVEGAEPLDIGRYEHVTLDSDGIGGSARFDALVPMMAAAADAAEQWSHAVVRFPDNIGWNDLLNRKTPGWEEWKQLGSLKDGKFQPQAAIKQAKLQPAAAANLALQGAAIIVGQAYMAEISEQLEGIQEGIAEIQREMSLEREANIEARYEKLQEYLVSYSEFAQDPKKRRAIQNSIEGICLDALAAWKFQVKTMDELRNRLEKPKRMKDDEVRECLSRFQTKERDALAAFKLYVFAEQASMQYDGDFSTARIEIERDKLEKRLQEYGTVRERVQQLLDKRIEGVKGNFFAVPDAKDDGYKAKNPVFDAAHAVRQIVPRFTPVAMRDEAKRRTADKKNRFSLAAGAANPVVTLGNGRAKELDRLDFIYNHADTMFIDEKGIHFLKSIGKSASSDEVVPKKVNDEALSA